MTVLGGTLAELADYIRQRGGEVAGATTLVNASRSGVRGAAKQHVRLIEERYGDLIRQEFGIEPGALTGDEALVVLASRDADTLRDRVAKARQDRERRLLRQGIRLPTGGAPNPDIKRSLPDGEPVARLSGDELGVVFRGPDDMPALRRAAQDWYRRNLIGSTARMADGTPVLFSGRGLRKATGPKATDYLLRAVPAIRAIIEHGRVVHRESGSTPRIVERIVIAAPVDVEGATQMLAVSVHKTSNGDYHYDLTYGWDDAGRPGVGVPGEETTPRRTSRQSAVQSTPGAINLVLWSDADKSLADLRAALAAGPAGRFLGRLIYSGLLRIEPGADPQGAQAWTEGDGTITLYAGSLVSDPTAVLLHEGFHSDVARLIGSPAWNRLMDRLGALYRQYERPGTGANRFFEAARARVAYAEELGLGHQDTALTIEEFGAYAIEEYESAPSPCASGSTISSAR